ncbi:MAG TPA: SUMF1/EgtB/PvdO family nonheme iron enzyme [Acidobacteriaceae bacterium]|nr:SUMF1/EgtB/PvdO family nonheme iron enzyme [Acidobacteriaceae bacterium]
MVYNATELGRKGKASLNKKAPVEWSAFCEANRPRMSILEGMKNNMRRLLWFWLAVSCCMLTSSLWSQQRAVRIALVIGNAAYPERSLSTAIADARSLADELRRGGFEVDHKTDLGKADMQNAIDTFTSRISSGVDALFYFSGIGIQVERQSYLMPTNAVVWSLADVRKDGIKVDSLLAEMHRKGARVKILIIDAARRSQWERRFRASPEGLAGFDALENTLAIYSAPPGKLVPEGSGTHSVFAGELIKEIRAANMAGSASVTAEDVFNHLKLGIYRASSKEQIPWVASSLVQEFHFGSQQTSAGKQQPAAQQLEPEKPQPIVANVPLRYQSEIALLPKDHFRECVACPEMLVVSEGEYMMGSPENEPDRYSNEGPQHRVKIPRRFAVSKLKITREEFEKFANEMSYASEDRCFTLENDKAEERTGRSFRNPGFHQDGSHPAVCISWDDAKAYVDWLSKKTGKLYRLLSESEWEYTARAGTKTPFWWGASVSPDLANYDSRTSYGGGAIGEYREKTVPADMFNPNPWGLYQVHGNAMEWVEDCWNETYQGGPADDWMRIAGRCSVHVRRGGAWNATAKMLRAAYRDNRKSSNRASNTSFRIARTLSQ